MRGKQQKHLDENQANKQILLLPQAAALEPSPPFFGIQVLLLSFCESLAKRADGQLSAVEL